MYISTFEVEKKKGILIHSFLSFANLNSRQNFFLFKGIRAGCDGLATEVNHQSATGSCFIASQEPKFVFTLYTGFFLLQIRDI